MASPMPPSMLEACLLEACCLLEECCLLASQAAAVATVAVGAAMARTLIGPAAAAAGQLVMKRTASWCCQYHCCLLAV
jgi:hypothetical protein